MGDAIRRFQSFEFNLDTLELRKAGRLRPLQRQPAMMLRMLIERPGQLVKRQELQRLLWDESTSVDCEVGLNAVVRKLRAALGETRGAPRHIETVARRGYRFRMGDEAVSRGVVTSIAVLPFTTASADVDDLSDGLTERIIQEVSQLPGIRKVIARNSVYPYRADDPLETGRRFNVQAVLAGRVGLAGDRIVLDAELLSSVDGQRLWGDRYERPASDAPLLPAEIAATMACTIGERKSRRRTTAPSFAAKHLWGGSYRPTRDDALTTEGDDRRAVAEDSPVALSSGRSASISLPPVPDKRTVAVLPLKLLTPAADAEFLSVALADAMINHLSANATVFVRPIAMVQRYAAHAADPLDVARELNVQVLVEGNIQKVASKLRVYLRALDAATGSTIVSAKHDAEMADLFTLQDAMGESLTRALQPDTEKHQRPTEDRPPGNRMAYELYLRAVDKLSRLNRWDTRAAIDMLRRAVRLDAQFAGAWARLAEAYLLMAFTFAEGPRAITAAERAARRALALDPSNSVAQCSHGLVLWSPARGFQNKAALRALSIALKLNPNNLTARLWEALIFLHVGLFDEADADLKIALAVRPDDATTLFFLGQSAMYRHRYEEADEYHARALAIDAAHVWSQVFYPVIPLYRGAFEDAERRLASARELEGDDPWLTSCEGLLYAKRGESAKAEQLLATALRGKPLFHTHHMWHTAAAAYAMLGNNRRALSLLERAAAFGLPNYTLFRDDPHFRSLHGLSRFQKLLACAQKENQALRSAISSAPGRE